MNTTQSDAKVKEWLARRQPFHRKIHRPVRTFKATPDKLFPLLCPTTEYDWLTGWDCEMVYSDSCYAEQDTIVTTDFFIPNGEVWTCWRYQPNQMIQFLRFSEHLVIRTGIRLQDNQDGTTTAQWEIVTTALNQQGNQMISSIPDSDEPFDDIFRDIERYLAGRPTDTVKSEARVKELRQSQGKYKRRKQRLVQTLDAPAAVVFPQFCPSRELDWIDGWQCDLIYTSTGYVEADCVFTTPATNVLGPGVWAFVNIDPNQDVELVRTLGNDLLIHFRINLEDHGNGTSTGTWDLTLTALTEEGNVMLDGMPEKDVRLTEAVAGLDHFLRTGDLEVGRE